MDRHVKPDEEGKKLRFKKEVTLDPEFQELWNRIKHKTTFSKAWKLIQRFSEDIDTIVDRPARLLFANMPRTSEVMKAA